MIEKYEDIVKDIEEWTGDEEKVKTLDRNTVEEMINNWLAEFKITQPSDFFKQNPTNDAELVCSILKEKEFLMNTLEFFGLPRGYMEGAGHHPNRGKENSNDKAAKAKLRAKARNQKKTNKGTANKIKALKEAR